MDDLETQLKRLRADLSTCGDEIISLHHMDAEKYTKGTISALEVIKEYYDSVIGSLDVVESVMVPRCSTSDLQLALCKVVNVLTIDVALIRVRCLKLMKGGE